MVLTGKKIKNFRKMKGLSQYELANRLTYLNQSQISKIEKGFRKVTDSDLINIASALGVQVTELISK